MKKDPSLDAFIKLTRAYDKVHQCVSQVLSAIPELSPTEFEILEALLHKGPLCQKQISQKILKSKGSVSQQIDNLETKGYLLRIKEDFDKRQYHCELTKPGEEVIKAAFQGVKQEITATFSVLNEEELNDLSKICKILGTGERPDSN